MKKFLYPGSKTLMPPRTKKRKVKESEEDLIFNEKLTEAFYKYRYEPELNVDEEAEDENVGMFENEEEEAKVLIEDIERICEAVGVVWDNAALAILDQEQRASKTVTIDIVKLIIETLKTVEKQKDDIEYLFNTFSDPNSQTISQKSLARSLKHLSIRESNDKIALLMAFAHEQSFLQLVLNEQTTGQPMSMLCDCRGITFEEFKRTFIRSTFLTNK